MPHLIVEHSPGVFEQSELRPLLDRLNRVVIESGAIRDEADLKSRVILCMATRIGAADEPRGFVHAQLRLLPGRGVETRARLASLIAGVLKERYRSTPGTLIKLSVEIVEMNAGSYVKETL